MLVRGDTRKSARLGTLAAGFDSPSLHPTYIQGESNMNTIKIERATVGRIEEAFPTKGGKLLVKFSVADNARKDLTRWFAVEAWNELAEQVLGSVAVGDKLDLEGYVDRVEGYISKKTNKPEAKAVLVLTALVAVEKKRAA